MDVVNWWPSSIERFCMIDDRGDSDGWWQKQLEDAKSNSRASSTLLFD